MKLTVVLDRPTQFDVPLFRHAAADPRHELRVLYTAAPTRVPFTDPELGRAVDWGEDLMSGYEHRIGSSDGGSGWLHEELAVRRDLVIVNGYTQKPYLAANRAARRAGSPTALRLDSVLFDEGSSLRRALKRALFRIGVRRIFRMFLAVGSETLRYLEALGVPPDRRGLFPYPVDTAGLRSRLATGEAREDLRRRLAIPETATVVLAVAKLHPRETPWDLLRGWKAASSDDAGRWLLLVGDGPERGAVEALIREQSLSRVHLAGYVPYPQLPAHYAASDLFVHAPREERWGVSVAEALACGLPVVSSERVGAASDLLVHGVNGARYEAGDAESLQRAIAAALALDPERVRAASEPLLRQWGVERSWQHLLEAAERSRRQDP